MMVIDVNIEPDESSLSEIVVVGYGASNDYQRPDYTYQPPRPVGGNTKFMEYIRGNMRYPSDEINEGIKGDCKSKGYNRNLWTNIKFRGFEELGGKI